MLWIRPLFYPSIWIFKINNSICLYLVCLWPPSFQWHLYPDYYFNLLTVLWTHLCCLNPALLHWQGLLENHTTKSPGAPILEKGYLFLFVFQWPEQLPDLWPVSSEQPVSFSQFLQLLWGNSNCYCCIKPKSSTGLGFYFIWWIQAT